MSKTMWDTHANSNAERALLVGVISSRNHRGRGAPETFDPLESLDELETLARSAGAEVVGRILQRRTSYDPATLVGAGKLEEIAREAEAKDADVVIFDHNLTPTQLRNIEVALQQKVVDRTQLILDIFARRARTREGQLQVELAQLNYLLPRLTGRGVEMSRLGGGIGTRGPGETKLETDRRRIARRIRSIREQLEAVRRSRQTQRKRRRGVPLPAIALVGYTNAGKSTLFNRLTGAEVYADDRLFATLDPTVRVVTLPSRRRAVLSDTVGFIRNLPTTLVEAFRATLEEIGEASLLLHVVDVSRPDAAEQAIQVVGVLQEIGAAGVPQVLVLNKVDKLDGQVDVEALRGRIAAHLPGAGDEAGTPEPLRAVAVSARTGEGLDRLLTVIDETLPAEPLFHATFRLPADGGRALHLLHEHGRVEKVTFEGDGCLVEASAPESILRRLSAYVTSVEPAAGAAEERDEEAARAGAGSAYPAGNAA